MFSFEVEAQADKLHVVLIGDMDIESYEVVHDRLIPEMTGHAMIVLDFAQVRFVDSTGIGLLIQLMDHVKKSEAVVKIVRLNKDVAEVFEILQIPDILGKEVFL